MKSARFAQLTKIVSTLMISKRQIVDTTTDMESLVDTMTRETRQLTYITDEAAQFFTSLHDDVWTRFYRVGDTTPHQCFEELTSESLDSSSTQSSVLWTRLYAGLCFSMDNIQGKQTIFVGIKLKGVCCGYSLGLTYHNIT